MTTNRKREFTLFQTSSTLFNFIQICQILAKFSGVEFESFEKEKENFCVVFTYFIKREHEARKFHVAVVQQRLRKKRDTRAKLFFCCSPSPL